LGEEPRVETDDRWHCYCGLAIEFVAFGCGETNRCLLFRRAPARQIDITELVQFAIGPECRPRFSKDALVTEPHQAVATGCKHSTTSHGFSAGEIVDRKVEHSIRSLPLAVL
jgi:hypothetical protein